MCNATSLAPDLPSQCHEAKHANSRYHPSNRRTKCDERDRGVSLTPVVQYDVMRLAASKQALYAVMLLTVTLILGPDFCAHSILASQALQSDKRHDLPPYLNMAKG